MYSRAFADSIDRALRCFLTANAAAPEFRAGTAIRIQCRKWKALEEHRSNAIPRALR